ncbi:hypothetical protein HPB47_009753 [Ixodes persulcatus]|uniref:Uncharacterized protein n=1 Tax=Ixodes persulcatus TaxID=34615 RepID=A0AC60P0Z3_IXOPE|nr:hypothetical protein HPB47_009753 [Ixodes persulcatus]
MCSSIILGMIYRYEKSIAVTSFSSSIESWKPRKDGMAIGAAINQLFSRYAGQPSVAALPINSQTVPANGVNWQGLARQDDGALLTD